MPIPILEHIFKGRFKNRFYDKFLAENKPGRHYAQHFLVGIAGFFITRYLFYLNTDWNSAAIFFVFTFLPDLDGLISIFIWRNKIKIAGEIVNSLEKLDFHNAAVLSTTHHKQFDRLIFHNIIGFFILIVLIYAAIMHGNIFMLNALFAVLSHFIFDILDDIKQLGHVRNWLWPIYILKNP